ncbi:MAG: SGNH/GDSL hydrolase family protein [Deltaproteobacteria bacterium]|nr:SGNH/GDSL hydrolase family protein [Deltaproteobacteria bacterium]
MSARPGRFALFSIAAIVLASSLGMAIAEAVLRLVDYPAATFSPWIRSERFGFRLAPDLTTRMRGPEYDVAVETNSLGFRDDAVGPKTTKRILLLGDSFAMGYGVERGEIFADRIERDLGVDVVNAATGGYEIVHQVELLKAYGKSLAPDLVVYALYLGNDLAWNDQWQRGQDGSLRSLVREYPVRRPHEIKLLRLARDFVYGLRSRSKEKEAEWLPFEGYLGLCERDLGQEALQDYDRATGLIGEMAEQVRGLGAAFFVVLVPYRSMVEPEARERLRSKVPDLDVRYDLTRPGREMDRRLTGLGVEHADSTPFLAAQHSRSGAGLFFPIDGHLTGAGHRALADFLEPLLKARLGPVPDL